MNLNLSNFKNLIDTSGLGKSKTFPKVGKLFGETKVIDEVVISAKRNKPLAVQNQPENHIWKIFFILLLIVTLGKFLFKRMTT